MKPGTNTPWKTGVTEPTTIWAGARPVATCTNKYPDDRGPENAAYIVHAANHYGELVAALESIRELADDGDTTATMIELQSDYIAALLAKCRGTP